MIESCLLSPTAIQYLLHVAIAATALAGAGALTANALRRRSSPLQHAILASTVALTLVFPILLGLTQYFAIVLPWSYRLRPETAELAAEIAGRAPDSRVPDTALPVPSAARSGAGSIEPMEEPPPSHGIPSSEGAFPWDSLSPIGWQLAGSLLAGVWFAGTLRNLFAALRAWLPLAGVRWSVIVPGDRLVLQTVAAAASVVGIRRPPPVFVSSLAPTPFCVGLFRTAIVLPMGIEREIDEAGLQAVLIHEMAHVVRHDCWMGLAQRLSAALFWWNPLIHRMNDRIAVLREEICDDYAIRNQSSRDCLARALVELAARITARPPLPATLGVLEPKLDGLSARVLRLLDKERNTMTRLNRISRVGVTLFALSITGILLAVSLPAKRDAMAVASDPGADVEATAQAKQREVAAPAEKPKPDPRVRKAIDDGVSFLKKQQRPDGTWSEGFGQKGGVTSLCTLALLRCGVVANDPAVQNALRYLRSVKPERTYQASLLTLVLASAEPKKDMELIRRNAQWIAAVQNKEDPGRGGWGYPARSDNSNSQFAIQGLDAAAGVGAEIRKEVWQAALDYWLDAQYPDGAWGYMNSQVSTGSMTCAGIASVRIAAARLNDPSVAQRANAALDRAFQWLEMNYSVTANPNYGQR